MTNSKVESVTQMEELMPLIREALASGRCVNFSPMGVSMLPMIRQGLDSVTLAPVSRRLEKYDIPLYRRENRKYVLHRIVAAGDTYTCMGDNQVVAESGLRQDQMIAVVTAFSRGGREIPVTDFRYRAYCRIWVGILPVRKLYSRVKGKLKRLLKRLG